MGFLDRIRLKAGMIPNDNDEEVLDKFESRTIHGIVEKRVIDGDRFNRVNRILETIDLIGDVHDEQLISHMIYEIRNLPLSDFIIATKEIELRLRGSSLDVSEENIYNRVLDALGSDDPPKKNKRKDWITYFIDMAEMAATRSTCDRLSVGCIIVKDNRMISSGYNGSIKGTPHCDDEGHMIDPQGRCIRTLHAEQNALIFAKEDLTGATAYVTHQPCEVCTKLLIQSGITKVYYKNKYDNKYINRILDTCNHVEFIHYKG